MAGACRNVWGVLCVVFVAMVVAGLWVFVDYFFMLSEVCMCMRGFDFYIY
jgi:hypothetical protein